MTLDQKKVMLSHVKHSFESVRKASVDPPQWITALPLPLIFLRGYEGMYHAAFIGGQVPVQAGIDLKALTMLDLSYSCRGGARSVVPMSGMPSSSSSSSSAGSFQVALGDSPLERMANTFMSRIESMASAQQRIMAMMLGGTARSSGTSGPRSLLAIANHDVASSVRRVPSFAFNSPQMALPDRVVDDVGVALAAASPDAPVEQLAQQPAPLALVAVQAAEAPPAQVSAAGNVEDMLNMLSEREDGKKKTKAAAKALALADDAAASIPDAGPRRRQHRRMPRQRLWRRPRRWQMRKPRLWLMRRLVRRHRRLRRRRLMRKPRRRPSRSRWHRRLSMPRRRLLRKPRRRPSRSLV